MKKLIILMLMLFIGTTFAQKDHPLLLMWGDLEGNLRDLNDMWFNTSDDQILFVLGGKFSLTQTGAQVQTILDGTFSTQIFGIDGGDAAPSYSFTNSTNSGIRWTGSTMALVYEGGKKVLIGGVITLRVDTKPEDDNVVDLGASDKYFAEGYINNVISDSLNVEREKSWVADDGEIVLATGVAGFGQAMIGDNQEWGHFRFTSAGAVTLIANSGNVVNTDTDAKFCIYDAGSGIAIKNRLGSALIVMIDIKYADPTP